MIRTYSLLLSVFFVLMLFSCTEKSTVKETTGTQTLSDKSVGEKTLGVVNVSVADTRTRNSYSGEMATQLLLGSPVKTLEHDGWWQIESAEGYISWIPSNSFVPMTKEEFNNWTTAAKIIFTDFYGFCYETADDKQQTVSDLVYGNILKLDGEEGRFYRVLYPDGRKGYVLKDQAKTVEAWSAGHKLNEATILESAFRMKGIPYTWGGTSVKGLDCSGFTKSVFFEFGIILLRDASQQAKTGTPVDITNGYDNLCPGDLLFFGKAATEDKPERVRHVAFYIGNKEFIHASGFIKINSLDPAQPNYDELNTKELLSATRIIGSIGTEGIQHISDTPLYNVQ